MTHDELKRMLESHEAWLQNGTGERANLLGIDLVNADLSNMDLRCANLRHTSLVTANLRFADLRGADLFCADLSGANLFGADLSEANLYGANLKGANLTDTNLVNANLSSADLQQVTGLTWAECRWSDHDDLLNRCLLLAARIANRDVYFCKDFQGSFDELIKYISNNESESAHLWTLAANFCAERMKGTVG